MFSDSHPRVRYAACQCVYVPGILLLYENNHRNICLYRGQLCTDLEVRMLVPKTNTNFSYAAGDYTGKTSSAALRRSCTGSGRSRT